MSKVLLQRPLCCRALFTSQHTGRSHNVSCRFKTDRASSVGKDGLPALLARFDSDGDGRLTIAEAQEAFEALQALQPLANNHSSPQATSSAQPVASTSAPAVPACPATWELQVLNGLRSARSRGQGAAAALASFLAAKLRNGGKARASASDLLWSFAGMFAAVTALGLMAPHVRSWPLVGEWHQQGLGLLLGSFGTITVLLFGRPEAEAIRVWNLLAGHVVSTSLVLALLHLLGPGLLTRSLAMGAMLAAMLATDCVHPPGGALVLMAVDSPAIQRMDWWFMLYPSLAITVAVLLPLGLAVNWLKRNVRFDFPAEASHAASPAPSAPSTPSRAPRATPPSSPPPPPPPPTGLRPKLA